MAIRQRKENGPYYLEISYKDPTSKKWKKLVRTTGTKNKKEALRIEKQMKLLLDKELDSELSTDGAAKTEKKAAFSGFAKTWLDNYAKPNNKPSTIRNKVYHIKEHLVPFFKNTQLKDISTEQIERFIALKVKSGLSKKTVNNITTTLRSMLKKAVEWEYLEKSPMDGVKMLKIEKTKRNFYTEEERELFLEACKQHKPAWHPYFLTAFLTGMRLGEINALQWRDIHFESQTITVQRSIWYDKLGTTKGNKYREIPLHPYLAETLKQHKHTKSLFVFCQNDGKHFSECHMRKAYEYVCKKAGIRKLRFHDIRHTFASHLVAKGIHLKVIQELLGHEDLKTTMIYAHLAPEMSKDAVWALMSEQGPEICSKLVANQHNQHSQESQKIEKACNIK